MHARKLVPVHIRDYNSHKKKCGLFFFYLARKKTITSAYQGLIPDRYLVLVLVILVLVLDYQVPSYQIPVETIYVEYHTCNVLLLE